MQGSQRTYFSPMNIDMKFLIDTDDAESLEVYKNPYQDESKVCKLWPFKKNLEERL